MSRRVEELSSRQSTRHINNIERNQAHTFGTEAKLCIRKGAMLVESLYKQAIGTKTEDEEEEA